MQRGPILQHRWEIRSQTFRHVPRHAPTNLRNVGIVSRADAIESSLAEMTESVLSIRDIGSVENSTCLPGGISMNRLSRDATTLLRGNKLDQVNHGGGAETRLERAHFQQLSLKFPADSCAGQAQSVQRASDAAVEGKLLNEGESAPNKFEGVCRRWLYSTHRRIRTPPRTSSFISGSAWRRTPLGKGPQLLSTPERSRKGSASRYPSRRSGGGSSAGLSSHTPHLSKGAW